MISITQLVDVASILNAAIVVGETVIVKVTGDLTGVLSLERNIPDYVTYKSLTIKRRNEQKCSAGI